MNQSSSLVFEKKIFMSGKWSESDCCTQDYCVDCSVQQSLLPLNHAAEKEERPSLSEVSIFRHSGLFPESDTFLFKLASLLFKYGLPCYFYIKKWFTAKKSLKIKWCLSTRFLQVVSLTFFLKTCYLLSSFWKCITACLFSHQCSQVNPTRE